VAREAALGDVGMDVVVESSMVHDLRAYGGSYGVAAVVGNDVDDTCYGIAAVEGAGGAVEDFDTADVREAEPCPTVVAAHAASVLKDDDVVVAHSAEVHEGAHAAGVGSDGGGQTGKGVLQGGDACVAHLLGGNDFDGNGAVVGFVIGARTRDDNGVERHLPQRIS